MSQTISPSPMLHPGATIDPDAFVSLHSSGLPARALASHFNVSTDTIFANAKKLDLSFRYRDGAPKDLTGQTFGNLTVLGRKPKGQHNVVWIVRCTCGKELHAGRCELLSGAKNRCGSCMRTGSPAHVSTGVYDDQIRACFAAGLPDHKAAAKIGIGERGLGRRRRALGLGRTDLPDEIKAQRLKAMQDRAKEANRIKMQRKAAEKAEQDPKTLAQKMLARRRQMEATRDLRQSEANDDVARATKFDLRKHVSITTAIIHLGLRDDRDEVLSLIRLGYVWVDGDRVELTNTKVGPGVTITVGVGRYRRSAQLKFPKN